METYSERLEARAAAYASRHKGKLPTVSPDHTASKLEAAWLAGASSALRNNQPESKVRMGHWIELRTEQDKPQDRYGRWFWRVRIYTGIGSGGLEVWEYNNIEDWDVGDGDENRLAGYISHVWSEPVEVMLPEVPPLATHAEGVSNA